MSRSIQWLNFLGIAAMTVLCAMQWHAIQNQGVSIEQLLQTRREQSAQIAEQDQKLKDDADDLNDLRGRLDASESALAAAQKRAIELQTDRDRLAANDEKLTKALDSWIVACDTRDTALKQANDSIATLSSRANLAATKYNELVGKYNDLAAHAQPATRPKQ